MTEGLWRIADHPMNRIDETERAATTAPRGTLAQ
jgi:hypothetical protein